MVLLYHALGKLSRGNLNFFKFFFEPCKVDRASPVETCSNHSSAALFCPRPLDKYRISHLGIEVNCQVAQSYATKIVQPIYIENSDRSDQRRSAIYEGHKKKRLENSSLFGNANQMISGLSKGFQSKRSIRRSLRDSHSIKRTWSGVSKTRQWSS